MALVRRSLTTPSRLYHKSGVGSFSKANFDIFSHFDYLWLCIASNFQQSLILFYRTGKGFKKNMERKVKSTSASAKTAAVVKKGAPLSHGVGRRKKAVARVFLRRGNGKITVNGKDYTNYFDTELMRLDAATPLRVVPVAMSYDFDVNVNGGGLYAQAGAVKLGISRAFVAMDEDLRVTLRQSRLLTVDSRVKERKKYGQKAARRKFQFAKR